jgi:hypothetical protein
MAWRGLYRQTKKKFEKKKDIKGERSHCFTQETGSIALSFHGLRGLGFRVKPLLNPGA